VRFLRLGPFLAPFLHDPRSLISDLSCIGLTGRGCFAFDGIKLVAAGVAVHCHILSLLCVAVAVFRLGWICPGTAGSLGIEAGFQPFAIQLFI